MVNYAVLAIIFMLLMEYYIWWRYRRYDQVDVHGRALIDRYYFWFVGMSVFISFLLGTVISNALHLPIFATTPWIVFGATLFVLGYALRFYAIAILRDAFSVVLRVAKNQQLVEKGPYRYVRHPSYTGAIIAFLGLGVLSGNPAVLVLLALTTLYLYLIRIRREESILIANLSGYPEYCKRTPNRIIPWIL